MAASSVAVEGAAPPAGAKEADKCPACQGKHKAHTCGRGRDATQGAQPAEDTRTESQEARSGGKNATGLLAAAHRGREANLQAAAAAATTAAASADAGVEGTSGAAEGAQAVRRGCGWAGRRSVRRPAGPLWSSSRRCPASRTRATSAQGQMCQTGRSMRSRGPRRGALWQRAVRRAEGEGATRPQRGAGRRERPVCEECVWTAHVRRCGGREGSSRCAR